MIIFYRINSKKGAVSKSMFGLKKAMSRKFNFLSSQKLQDLREIRLKKRTHAKMNWGVNAFKEWRVARLHEKYDGIIAKVDLDSFRQRYAGEILVEHWLCTKTGRFDYI